jgi:hypothetical protein
MATDRQLSLRLDEETFERLAAQSRRSGQEPSQLAKTLLEEGIRMEAHPGIVFRPGPAGRRAGLASGPDVWEVIRVYRGIEAPDDSRIRQTAELTGQSSAMVLAAVGYYSDYPVEIDDWIRRIDVDATAAEAAWQHEQSLRR